ncbi:MAG: molybdenum ABC transporter ATP-binding protein [Cereibacter sphaeroides]|uniref:Molybdenum ABC transporter ATP-binding protein n=1 Tax=Cereibacter sphaeroides TaxID=1063 RepID=A0A2W5SLY8_CERSP|nr:MAG: molybdenum ABC transporter ATP-binding protein [Cereibacter sphaeroides]
MTLEVRVRHAFGGFALDAAFDAPAGLTALFGRSGSGKTTVINAVAGLLRPDEGRIAVDGRVLFDSAQHIDLAVHRRRLGYVFQEGRLFPHLTVRQNLLYGRWFSGVGGGASLDRVVDMLGIEKLLARRPGRLSGGEKARVAIGRALLSNPSMLLLDEPLAALDEARKAEIMPYLERLRDDGGIPILYVSHAIAEVARLGTTMVVMEAGKVARAGPATEVLADPAAVPSLGVREAGAVITARVAGQDPDGLTRLETQGGALWLPRLAAEPGTVLRVRIAAQDIMIALKRPEDISALNILPAVVTAVRLGEGPGAMVQLSSGGDLLLARITRRSVEALALAPGCEVFAVVKSVAVAQSDVGVVL